MVYEYAIDPELILKWSRSQRDFSDFIKAFGIGTTRIPSVVQDLHKWKRKVWMRVHQSKLEDIEKKRIDSFLKIISEAHIKRPGSQINGNWYEKVIKENKRISFDCIFVNDRSQCNTNNTIIQDDLYNDLPDKEIKIWNSPIRGDVKRTAKNMSNLTGNLLRLSSHIIFIDPYLHVPKVTIHNKLENKLEPIKEFINKALENQIVKHEINFEIIYSKDKIEKNNRTIDNKNYLDPNSPENTYEGLFEYLKENLDKNKIELINLTVKDISEKAYIKNNTPVNEQFHNRYILTEFGGVNLGTGLDQSNEFQTDDWHLLSKEQYNKRWKQYVDQLEIYYNINDIYPPKKL